MPEEKKQSELTRRQIEILSLLRKGLTNQEIARSLCISQNTVKVHLANIYKILDVTNRTEASSIQAPHALAKNKVQLLFCDLPKFETQANARHFYLTLIKDLNQFDLFNVQVEKENLPSASTDFFVNATYSEGEEPTLFFSLHHVCSPEILWYASYAFVAGKDLQLEASRLAIRLWVQLELASARLYKKDSSMQPSWWYATSYYRVKGEGRTKEIWLEAKEALEVISKSSEEHIYVSFALVDFHYKALLEQWCALKDYQARIQELAAHGMRFRPNSQYSMFIIALSNILAGSNEGAAFYLEKIIAVNPLNSSARHLLAQMYMLLSREELGLEQLSEYQNLYPASREQPYIQAIKALLFCLAKRFDECIQHCADVLFIIPETTVTRLVMISALGWTSQLELSQKHIDLFYHYHPNFKLADLGNVTGAMHVDKRNLLLEGISRTSMKIQPVRVMDK